jgi:hypothetical protein
MASATCLFNVCRAQIERRRLRGKLAGSLSALLLFCASARFVTTGDLFLIIIILEFTHHYPRDERAAHQGLDDSNTCVCICMCVRRDRRFFSLWSFARASSWC